MSPTSGRIFSPGSFIYISKTKVICKRCGQTKRPRKVKHYWIDKEGMRHDYPVSYTIGCARCHCSAAVAEHVLPDARKKVV